MRNYLRTVFGLDLRSLALLRILVGLIVLASLFQLFPDAGIFLSDEGFMPRSQHLENIHLPWSLSLYMMLETPFQVRLLMLAHALIAVGLVLGLRTRLCAVANWVLLISLQNRNPLILNGGDTVLALLSFWLIFLPINRRTSLDRIHSPEPPEDENQYADLPAFALILQICLVYWMTVLFKNDPVWWNGQAVSIALEADRFVTGIGIWMRSLKPLHEPLSWMTILWELAGPMLLFVPIRNAVFRLVAIFGFVLFHASLELTMELGFFPAVCIAAWLALLPREFWAHTSRWRSRFPSGAIASALRSIPMEPGRLIRGTSIAGRVLSVLIITYITLWNLRSYDAGTFGSVLPSELNAPGHLLRLRQKWNMFSPRPPRVDGWFVLRARQHNGQEIDLLASGQPLDWEKPALVTAQFPNRRWGKYFDNLRTDRRRELRGPMADTLIRQWNQSADVGYQIAEAELYFMLERTNEDGSIGPVKKQRLWYRRNIQPDLH